MLTRQQEVQSYGEKEKRTEGGAVAFIGVDTIEVGRHFDWSRINLEYDCSLCVLVRVCVVCSENG